MRVTVCAVFVALAAVGFARYQPPLRGVGQLPKFAPTWDMQLSTIAMPCNDSGLLDINLHSQFGLIDIDWSNGKQIWVNPPMNCEELLLTQAALLKQANPNIKVFVYRNLVKALPWYSSVRSSIGDSSKSNWFLQFKPNITYHVPQCDTNWNPPRCTQFYHDQDQTPEYPHGDGSCPGPCDCGPVPCGEYLWDHNHGGDALRQWLVNDFVMGPTGLGNSAVSGFYFDDGWANTSQPVQGWEPKEGFCDHSQFGGATEEDLHCANDSGLTQADTTAITDAWRVTMQAVQDAVINGGGWAWQYFYQSGTPGRQQCATQLRHLCSQGNASDLYTNALQYSFSRNSNGSPVPLPSFMQDLATFLLVRGPYAWIGYGWVGCNVEYEFPDELKRDYGVPLGTCQETAANSGVFVRKYSKALVEMDCNSWTGTITPA